MPLLLLAVPLVAGSFWVTAKATDDITKDATKLAVIAGVAYLAWINRGAIAKLAKF